MQTLLCPKLLLVCKYCEEDVPASEMSEHESRCGDSLRECPRCAAAVLGGEGDEEDRWVPLRDWERHLANCHGLLVQRSPGRQRKQSSTQGEPSKLTSPSCKRVWPFLFQLFQQ